MTDQTETKQVTWQDLEVADPRDVPKEHLVKGVDYDYHVFRDGDLPEEYVKEDPVPRGVLILKGIDEEARSEAVEKRYTNNEPVPSFRNGESFTVIHGDALCSPGSRNFLTSRGESIRITMGVWD